MDNLMCYASGSGSLSFTWLNNGNATGRKVTKDEVLEYVNQHPEFKNWWVLQMNGTHWELVHPVRRVNAETLEVDGRHFRYWLDPAIKGWKTIRLATVYNEDLGKDIEVRNQSILDSLKFFLRNEDRLKELLPAADLQPLLTPEMAEPRGQIETD